MICDEGTKEIYIERNRNGEKMLQKFTYKENKINEEERT